MKKSLINKRIKKQEKKYYDACDRINNGHTKIKIQLDNFRMNCVREILRLKDSDKEIIRLRKLKEQEK